MIYAFLTGKLPIIGRFADGFVYGVLIFCVGILLCNVFRYALSDSSRSIYRFIFLFLLSVLVAGCLVGIETLVLYLCFPSSFEGFIASVPVRLFITALWFVIIRLYALSFNVAQEIETVSDILPPTTLPPIERITIRNGQKIKIIPIEDILYLQADGDYIAIHTAEGHWLKEVTMKSIEETLPPNRFVRIHRSFIVNLMHISRIERYGEQQSIVLHNGEKIKISAARYPVLKQRLDI
jgi:hypothetical protein